MNELYKFEVYAKEVGGSGYCPLIGYVEVDAPDRGDAMDLAKYHANIGSFDTKRNEYSEDDVAYVYLA